jgi:WD40 repeat protein
METIHSSAFSPDGALLLLGCGDGSVRSIELATGDEGPIFGGHQGIIREIVFATDEKLFATASSDGTARLWELRSGRIVQTFEGHTSGVNAGVFMPGGKRIATAGADNTVRVWDRETGEELLLLQHTSRLWSLACSPDGTLLAAGDEDKKIRLWRAPRID